MTQAALLVTVLTISAALMIPAAVFKDRDFSPLFLGFSCLLLIIFGVIILADPLEFNQGTTITETATGYTVAPVTHSVPTPINTLVGIIFSAGGLGGVYAAYSHFRSLKEFVGSDDGLDSLAEL